MRFIGVVSAGGSLMDALLKNPFFKSNIFSVVSDRECPAIEKVERHGIKTVVLYEKNKELFSIRLLEYLKDNNIDFVFSFFTKFFVGDLLKHYNDKIINLHPALLPAFKGFNGVEQAVRYHVRYVGSTIHFIDEKMDEGKIIIQTISPLDVNKSLNMIRHTVFIQQCKSLLQVMKWLVDNRIEIKDKEIIVKDAKFKDFEFSPNLDFKDAIEMDIPFRIENFSHGSVPAEG